MELKVFWTDTALIQLKDIFDYYKVEANVKLARKIADKIVNRTIQLERNPRSGQIEPFLKNRQFEYRYLVEGNYKIIYWISKTIEVLIDNYISISCRIDS